MLHCSLLWTSCLRSLTKSPAIPQQLYKTASSALSAIAELLVDIERSQTRRTCKWSTELRKCALCSCSPSSSVKITNRLFRCPSSYLWNQLPASFRQSAHSPLSIYFIYIYVRCVRKLTLWSWLLTFSPPNCAAVLHVARRIFLPDLNFCDLPFLDYKPRRTDGVQCVLRNVTSEWGSHSNDASTNCTGHNLQIPYSELAGNWSNTHFIEQFFVRRMPVRRILTLYSATSNNMKLVVLGGLLHLVQRWGDWAVSQPVQAPSRCTKCNSPPINGQCTSHV